MEKDGERGTLLKAEDTEEFRERECERECDCKFIRFKEELDVNRNVGDLGDFDESPCHNLGLLKECFILEKPVCIEAMELFLPSLDLDFLEDNEVARDVNEDIEELVSNKR